MKANRIKLRRISLGVAILFSASALYAQSNTEQAVKQETEFGSVSTRHGTIEEKGLITYEITPNDFNYAGLSYASTFEDAGNGFYDFDATCYAASGWGFNFGIGGNWGLVDSDFSSLIFMAGPSYGYVLHEKVLLSASFDFVGQYANLGEGMQTGVNAVGESYTYQGTDSKFFWGFALIPKLVFKFGKIMPSAGLELQWMEEAEEVTVGFTVGLGIDI